MIDPRRDRDRVRAIVREELERRLVNPALADMATDGPETCLDTLDLPERRACIIEPDRPCYNSGYCKKLGY